VIRTHNLLIRSLKTGVGWVLLSYAAGSFPMTYDDSNLALFCWVLLVFGAQGYNQGIQWDGADGESGDFTEALKTHWPFHSKRSRLRHPFDPVEVCKLQSPTTRPHLL
jgi:hypothetical protein